MQSAILWYSTVNDCLSDLGFTINKYDPSVANAIIEGKQFTICWYIDDSKISHVNPKVVDWVIMKLEERFGKIKVKRGKLHTFVGMDIEMKENKTVGISKKDYIVFKDELVGILWNRFKLIPFILKSNSTSSLDISFLKSYPHIPKHVIYYIVYNVLEKTSFN